MLALILSAAACGAAVKGAVPETDPAIIGRFAAVRALSEVSMTVTLCRMPDRGNPTAGSKREPGGRRAQVFISGHGRQMSDGAQLALFAHEFAHLVLELAEPEPPFWHQMSYGEYLEREARADALGASWVGREVFTAVFRESLASERGHRPGFIKEMTYRDLRMKYGW